MKRTLFAAGMALWIAGCGNDLVVTTVAEAREVCDAWELQRDAEWDAGLIVLQALRDGGMTKVDALWVGLDTCADVPEDEELSCGLCFTTLIDAIWSDR